MGEYLRQALTKGELSGISMGLVAVPASRQPRPERQGLARPDRPPRSLNLRPLPDRFRTNREGGQLQGTGPSIDTTSRTGKLVMGILGLIAEFENDIRRERQVDGIAKAKDRGVKFGRKRELTDEKANEIRTLRESGETVPAIIKRTGFSKASIYRALNQSA
jgi:hypothetical protein